MKLTVKTSISSYEVIIEQGIRNKITELIDVNRKIMIISDDGVPSFYVNELTSLLPNSFTFIFKQGEESKSLNTYQKIIYELIKHDFDRHDLIIAIGGGVVGDISLFAGSTYKRGIDVVLIPTTVLAMCDSSIGGKCGIDFNYVKNAIGTFYQPSLVLIDTDYLKTLSYRHLINGLVEALKMGMIYNETLFNYFINNDYLNHLEDIIYLSILGKKSFVETDEKEHSIRKALNFGHTIGHAIESFYHYDKYLHGEAVGYGMLKMVRNKEVKSKLNIALNNLGLIYDEKIEIEKLLHYIYNDKKIKGEKIDIVNVNKIGSYELNSIKLEDILKMLKEE